MRSDVSVETRARTDAATEAGAKMTTSALVVAGVTMVLAESDVGLPKGP